VRVFGECITFSFLQACLWGVRICSDPKRVHPSPERGQVTVGDGECLVVPAIGHEQEPLATVSCLHVRGFVTGAPNYPRLSSHFEG